MDAQDEIVDLLVNWEKNTFGGLCFNGVMHMNDEYGTAGYEETDYWTVFGDPSLQVRTDTPTEMDVEHNPIILDGATTYELDVPDIENALCAVSYDYTLLGYGYTDETGHVMINFETPISEMDEVELVATSFNKIPYITSLNVVSKRQPAEFETMQGVLIRYPFGISYEIIAEMAEGIEVVTIVEDASEESYVTTQYTSHGVNLDHCSFLYAPTDTYWTRDYGPWFIYDVDGNQGVVDFEYNRPRPYDNAIPGVFATEYGLPLDYLNLVHTGGNYMTDGQGISISTDLVWIENPGLSHEEIDGMVADILGIRTYYVVPDVLGEYIEHIDCWAKYLAPDKIMIIEVPIGHSQYDEIEDAVDYFESQLSCYNTPYEIYRIYTPSGQPYINSLILNDKALIPIDGGSWDDEAILSYQTAMPGYEVLGFTGSWASTDALHCRAKGISDRYMLYIEHTPLLDGAPSDDGFQVKARIVPYSGESLITDSIQVIWKLESDEWNTIIMDSIGDDWYQAYIPPQASCEIVYYYIHAEDNSGRSENHPYIGAPDAHEFTAIPIVFADDFETDKGWTVEDIDIISGSWERGVPIGDGTRGDPVSDYDGSGQCYLTGNAPGNSDVDGGPTRLISPTFDLSGTNDPELRYARWFTNDDHDEDRLDVEISDDNGASWTLIESVADIEGEEAAWVVVTISILDYVDLTSQIKVRFSVADVPNNSKTEAAVDDVKISFVHCGDIPEIDWWPMFHHDPEHIGYSTSTAPDTNNTIWNYTIGHKPESSPAVADGKVYIGTKTAWHEYKMYCFDAENGGEPIWNHTITGLSSSSYSSPAVVNGKVYIGSTNGKIYCLNADDGTELWNFSTGGSIFSSPTVADGYVYIGSHSRKVYCINADTGLEEWNYTTDGHVTSSPTVVNNRAYVGSIDGKLYCLDAIDGNYLWNFTTLGPISYCSPAVVDGFVYFGSWDNNTYCIDTDGNLIWTFTTGGKVLSSPAVAYGNVYIGSYDNKVYCLDAIGNGDGTTTKLWEYETESWVFSSPAVADGKVYVGSRDGTFYCFDAVAGDLIWMYYADGIYPPVGGIGSSPAIANGKVYVASTDGHLYAFGDLSL